MNISITDIKKAEIFTSIFKDIKLFTNDINIMFEPDRLYIQSMDSAHVMLFEIILPKKWFNLYQPVSKTGSITIGINSNILFRILNTREKNQTIEIVYDSDDSLSIEFNSDVRGEFTKKFVVPLIDINSDMLAIPEIDDTIEIIIDSNIFAKSINQLTDFGDTLGFECNEDKMILSSKTDELSKMSIDVLTDDLESFSILEGVELKLNFSLKYLQNICKFCKISKNITLNVNPNHPMKLVYLLETDGENTGCKMTFYLAPKMDDEEE
jgi:proliferating cell nuclear antigen PCNA